MNISTLYDAIETRGGLTAMVKLESLREEGELPDYTAPSTIRPDGMDKITTPSTFAPTMRSPGIIKNESEAA